MSDTTKVMLDRVQQTRDAAVKARIEWKEAIAEYRDAYKAYKINQEYLEGHRKAVADEVADL